VVEDEDLLGDGVNVAARLKLSMSTPQAPNHATFEKAREFFDSLLEQQSVQVAGSSRLRAAPPARIAQAVRKGESPPPQQSSPDNLSPILATHLI
jgi:hypothetical protein